jgi:hypothetical protein
MVHDVDSPDYAARVKKEAHLFEGGLPKKILI